MLRPLDPRLLRLAGPFVAAIFVLGAAMAALAIAQAVLLAGALTGPFPVALLGVLGVRAALLWASEMGARRASSKVKSVLRTRLLQHSLALGPNWLSGERSGELTTLVTRGVDALDDYFARYLPQLALAAIVPVAVLAVLAGADWPSAATVAVTLPLIPVFAALIGLYTQARMDRQWALLGRLAGHFLDVVAGLPTLKVFGRAKAQAATVGEVTERYRGATMATLRVAFLSSAVLELVATVSIALVAVSVGLRLAAGSLDLHTALVVLLLAPEAYLPLRAAGAQFHASAEGLAAADRVFAVLGVSSPVRGSLVTPRGPIEVRGVRVDYPGREVPALDGFSLVVRPGEVVALAGPSGCGKSTVLAVLLGFVAPSAGAVLVDGVPLASLDLRGWRRRIGWAPQRPHLFAGTVAANLRLGSAAGPDTEDVGGVARLLGVDELLDRVVGDEGAGISAGQRQRIGLARALLRPGIDLLLLDEPTSHLDGHNSRAVVEAIRAAAADGRTVLLVTHSPALLAAADRVVTL